MGVLNCPPAFPVGLFSWTLRCPAPTLGTLLLVNKHLLSVSCAPVSSSQGALFAREYQQKNKLLQPEGRVM